jgi:hypothetical protein
MAASQFEAHDGRAQVVRTSEKPASLPPTETLT